MTSESTYRTVKDVEELPVRSRGIILPIDQIRAIIAYGVMGLCNNYQRVTLYVSNLDVGNDIAKKDVRPVKDEYSIGSLLLLENIPELLEVLLSRVMGKSTMIKLAVSVVCSALGYYLVGFGTKSSLQHLGLIALAYSFSASFSALCQHLAMFNKRSINAYLVGLQFADILAPLYYALSADYLTFAQRLIPIAVVPVIQLIVFWALLREREQEMWEHIDSNDMINITKVFGTYRRFKQNWKQISPFALQMFLQIYTCQGLFRHLKSLDLMTSHLFNFRLYYAIHKGGKCLGSLIAIWLWTTQIWLVLLIQLLNFIVLLSGLLQKLSIWALVPLLLCEGMLGGYSGMCTYFAIHRKENDNPETIALDLKVIRQAEIVSGIAAGTGLILSEETIARLMKDFSSSY